MRSAYLQSYQNYFWQWEFDEYADADIISLSNGRTVIYKPLLLEFLWKLAPHGFPPFGSLLLAFVATNPDSATNLNDLYTQLGGSGSRLPNSIGAKFLELLSSLPEEYKTGAKRFFLFKCIFQDAHNRVAARRAKQIVQKLQQVEYINQSQFGTPVAYNESNHQRDFRTLELLGERFISLDDIYKALSGLDELDDDGEPLLEEETEREPISFTEELLTHTKTFHVGALLKTIQAALDIAFHSQLPSDQPLGGVADLTNKGDLDKLLISEYANDDMVFLSRLANNEALYLHREAPPSKNKHERIFLIDASLRNWGTVKTLLHAATIAIAKHPKSDFAYRVFSTGDEVREIQIDTVPDVIDGLNVLYPSIDASSGIADFFANYPISANAQVLFLSGEEALKALSFQKTLAEYGSHFQYRISASASGQVALHKNLGKSWKHVQNLQLNLPQLWTKKSKQVEEKEMELPKRSQKIADKPIGGIPLLLPNPEKVKAIFVTEENFIIKMSTKGQLFRYHQRPNNVYTEGWELLFGGEKFVDALSAVSYTNQGDFVLLQYRRKTQKISLHFNSSGEVKEVKFPHWRPFYLSSTELEKSKHNPSFIFKTGAFHHFNFNGHWRIGLDGVVSESHGDFRQWAIKAGERLQGLDGAVNYRNTFLKRFRKIMITDEGYLNINGFSLDFSENLFSYNNQASNSPKWSAEHIGESMFRFPEGSTVKVTSIGVINLRSSNPDIPDVYLSTGLHEEVAMATETDFAGNRYYLRNNKLKLILNDAGSAKLNAVKMLKFRMDSGLKEAKELVDSVPSTLCMTEDPTLVKEFTRELDSLGCRYELEEEQPFETIYPNTLQSCRAFYNKHIQKFIDHIEEHASPA